MGNNHWPGVSLSSPVLIQYVALMGIGLLSNPGRVLLGLASVELSLGDLEIVDSQHPFRVSLVN